MGQLKISPGLIDEVSRLVNQATGVQLSSNKSMVQFRLTKRLLELGCQDGEAYLAFLREHLQEETNALISLLTTHHTFFFREFSHFDYLEQEALPKIVAAVRAQGRKTIKIWSAACSRGQEVYSLAMFLNVHLKRIAPDMNFEILGSDVDQQSVDIASNGVYRWDEVKEIPSVYLMNNWIRGTGEIKDFVKAKTAIKAPCKFRAINLVELPYEGLPEKFDLVLCRNVFIYFKPEQIEKITHRIHRSMQKHAFFFIGLSENLNNLKVNVKSVGPSVYQDEEFIRSLKVQSSKPVPGIPLLPTSESNKQATAPAGKIKVFCIDDSSTVLTLMKKVFNDPDFELIGTAINGEDAAEKLKTLKPDVVTLDIHMPKMSGVEYLEKHFRSGHPPVIMVSSVSREDSNLGIRALELGASDYVEKPSLQDLSEKSEEIKMKARLAHRNFHQPATEIRLEKDFARDFKVADPKDKLNVIVGGVGDRERIRDLISGWQVSEMPATVVLLHGAGNLVAGIAKDWKVTELNGELPAEWKVGQVYIADFKKMVSPLRGLNRASVKQIVVNVLGELPTLLIDDVLDWKAIQIVMEEDAQAGSQMQRLRPAARFVVPMTSMTYHARQILSGELT